MSKKNTINEELLAIIKALSAKIESLEKTVYSQDNILMKSGFVVTETPVPIIENNIGSTITDVSNMEWSDIHKMVDSAGGQ